jgi:putative pyrroloquinoline-quinone binding quinoprotein
VTIADLDVAPLSAGRRRRMVPSRSVALFVIGLFVLALVTGSVRSAAQFAGLLWSGAYDRDNDTVTLTPSSLIVFHHGTLTVYDPGTGATRWSAPSAAVMAQVPSAAGGVVVAPDGFERYFQRPDLLLARTTRTIARDARTGAVLWRAAGAPQDVTDRSVLLLDDDTVRDVSLRDGHTLWSRPVPGLASVVVLGDAVITAATDGRLTVLRYGDGSVTRTAKVPWPGSARLSTAAGRLVVSSQAPSGQTNTVYRPDTLTELWQAGGALFDCRAVVCGTETGGLAGYDPDSGARRWRLAGATVAYPLRDDRIVASSELGERFQLLDPATGRPLGAAGTGLGTWGSDGRTAVADAPPATSAFVLRGTVVLRLDLRTGGQYRQSAVDGGGWLGCRNVAKYLVCRQESRLTVIAAPEYR